MVKTLREIEKSVVQVPLEPVAESTVDNFLWRLTESLAKRINEKLKQKHDLSETEVKILEFCINQIRANKKSKTKNTDAAVIAKNDADKKETQSNYHAQELVDNVIDLPHREEEKEGKTSNMVASKRKKLTDEINDELKSLLSTLENQHTKQYHSEIVAIDNKDTTTTSTQPTVVANSNAVSKKEVHANEVEKNRNARIDVTSDKAVTDRINNAVEEYMKFVEQHGIEVKRGENPVHDKIVDDILSLVTKKHRDDDGNEEVIEQPKTNNQANDDHQKTVGNKMILTVDKQFAAEVWKRLGVKKVKQKQQTESEELVKKSHYCHNQPSRDCQVVCFGACKEVCLDTTELVCTGI